VDTERRSEASPFRAAVLARALFAVGAVVAAAYVAPRARVASAPHGDWPGFVTAFLDAYFDANPPAAVSAGRHEYDGRLPDWSPEAIRGEIARLERQREAALAFRESDLTPTHRFERDYLVASIDGLLFWMKSAEWPFRNPTYYSGSLDPDVYVTREYAPLSDRMRAYVRYAREVPRAARQVRANLRTPMPRTWVAVGRITFGGLARYYAEDVPGVFAEVKDATLQREFQEANEGAVQAMTDLDRWLAEEEKRATDDFAIGAERFAGMLRATERVEIPLERLKEIGERDLQRNVRALEGACRALAPGASVADCVDRVRRNKPESGPVAAARRQLRMLRTFVETKDLVTIPGTEQAEVEESPPHMRWNFAYIDIPGPYEHDLPSVYYIAPPDPSWSREEQLDYVPGEADLLFTSVHEVWPGHFLQFLHANRSASTFGRVFVGYAFAEGWAHYSEEMMWEAGLGEGSPETHVGQLLNALLRNARYLSAIGLHTGAMTVEESERLFRERAFQDAGTARQQAARGTFDPGYLNYTLGKLMILELREEWTATRGGRKAWKDFHDAVLGYGGPPIPLIRADMLGPRGGPPLDD
jgi:hypothetical protein